MARLTQRKYLSDGVEYDSREEYLYHQILLLNENVSCIHRQVRINLIKPIWMLKPMQLKTKVRYDKRLMINGHNYTADFVFFENERLVICDVKSKYTHSLREFRITAKACVSRIMAHNKKRHGGEPFVVFREAIHIRKNEWKIIDYPPSDCSII